LCLEPLTAAKVKLVVVILVNVASYNL